MKIHGTLRVSGNVTMMYSPEQGKSGTTYIKGDLSIIDGDVVAFATPSEADIIGNLYVEGDIILFETQEDGSLKQIGSGIGLFHDLQNR